MTNDGSVAHISIPIAVGVIALLLGVGGTVFYFGGSLRQIDVNSANLSRLSDDVRKLPAADSDFRAEQAALRTLVLAMQTEVNTIRLEFRPREYWERSAGDIASLKLQLGELIVIRDRAVPEWSAVMQRIASLEAHFNDLTTRTNQFSSDVRDELTFYRNTAARRLETPPAAK